MRCGALCNCAALRAAPFTANYSEPLQQNAALTTNYATRWDSAEATSCGLAPTARWARMRNSRDTLESAASSFATRDWLEPTCFSRVVCVRPAARRRTFRLRLSATRISTNSASSRERFRKAQRRQRTNPPFPGAFASLHLSSVPFRELVGQRRTSLLVSDNPAQCGRLWLLEAIRDHNRVWTRSVDHTPRLTHVHDAAVVARNGKVCGVWNMSSMT